MSEVKLVKRFRLSKLTWFKVRIATFLQTTEDMLFG